MNRAQFLSGLIGKPWAAGACGPDAYDCWHLVVGVQAGLFGRLIPGVDVPEAPTWPWMIKTIREHPERERWKESEGTGHVNAIDGAIVLMARSDRPAHVGVWLRPEFGVIHSDAKIGVTFQSLVTLRTAGWLRLRFFEPR